MFFLKDSFAERTVFNLSHDLLKALFCRLCLPFLQGRSQLLSVTLPVYFFFKAPFAINIPMCIFSPNSSWFLLNRVLRLYFCFLLPKTCLFYVTLLLSSACDFLWWLRVTVCMRYCLESPLRWRVRTHSLREKLSWCLPHMLGCHPQDSCKIQCLVSKFFIRLLYGL